MGFFSRILVGALVIGFGVLMVYKTQWFLNMVGRIEFAEKFFGGGGSRMFFKLLGVATSIIGMMIMTNSFDMFIGGLVRRIFGL